MLVSFLIIGIAFVCLARGFVISEKKQSLSANATEISKIVVAYGDETTLNSWELRMMLSSVSRVSGNRVFVCDTNGLIVSCSDMDAVCRHIGQYVPGSVISSISSDSSYEAITSFDGIYTGKNYVVGVEASDRKGYLLGYVFVSSDSASVIDTWNVFMIVYLIVAMMIMLVTTVISYFTTKYQAKPLNEMAQAAHKFAKGDFSVRIEDEGRIDEIGELTRAFNSMADSLERSDQRRSEFISNVSHELKTPMTSIAGFADGILDGTIPPEEQNKYLATISSETKRLSRLVRSMLDLGKLQAQTPEELMENSFDINELLLRTLLNFEGKINERHLDVDVQLPEDDMTVRGDSDSIMRVVYNLLDNAIKFAHEGTTITLSLWKTGALAFVSVKDEGETIPPEDLPLIFDRFHKTDRSRSLDRDGVGLGLYLVKTIINNHGQRINVTSENGITEFVFTLALKEE